MQMCLGKKRRSSNYCTPEILEYQDTASKKRKIIKEMS